MLSLFATLALTAPAPQSFIFTQYGGGNTTSAAADPAWKLKADDPGSLTFAVGIAFEDATHGIVAGGANGIGAEILESTDGGGTFTKIDGINFGLDLLLLGAEAAHDTIIVAAIFGELYSLDRGKNWRASLGGGMSQSVRYIGSIGEGDGKHFGIAGVHNGKQGVGITKNGGITFKSYPIPELTTDARYAVYPNEKVWYVAAGAFPTNPPPPPPTAGDNATAAVRRFRKSELMLDSGFWDPEVHLRAPVKDGSYSAQIVKTVDGGATWTSQFSQNGTFYFNEIDCAKDDPNTCCTAGESSGSAAPGIHIYCTANGQDWKQTFFMGSEKGHSYTLMGLEFTSATEAWGCGGSIGLFTKPLFLHTTDGGATWASVQGNADLAGSVCLGLDMISEDVGYAAVDNVGRQTASVAKFSTDAPIPPPAPPAPPVPPPPGQNHYGDPNAGSCLPDEKAVQITGVTGGFCSPGCTKSTPCPTDVPDSATATPTCALSVGGGQPTQCALICAPSLNDPVTGANVECPAKATCKAVSNTGLCTYDA
jgi:photosystem II stability/assembly factor-like uncharacterized protein